jgi:hypothetical protein
MVATKLGRQLRHGPAVAAQQLHRLALNASEYGGIFGINRHPLAPSALSRQKPMKPGEDQW